MLLMLEKEIKPLLYTRILVEVQKMEHYVGRASPLTSRHVYISRGF